MSAEAPIATYRERLIQVGRVIELYPDRVVVKARWLMGSRFEQVIRLQTLTARTQELRVRQRLFKPTLAIASLAFAAAIVFGRHGVNPAIDPYLVYGCYAIAVVVGSVATVAFRKVLFIRFPTKEGKPGLDIAKSGPDAGRFDAFIEEVKRAVRGCSSSGG